jgi:hypothetical protein
MTKLAKFSLDQQASLLQNMSIEQLNQLFSKGTPVTLNRDIPEEMEEEGIMSKIQLTGLTEEKIRVIETDKKNAVLWDIIHYCKGLNMSLIDFLQDELVLCV